MEFLPEVIEDIIQNYADHAAHYDKFKKCLKKIKSIERKEYKYDNEHICELILNGKMSYYRLIPEGFEAENSFVNSHRFNKYWFFKNDKLDEYYENKKIKS